jgi:PAS domain S-box-containing protein
MSPLTTIDTAELMDMITEGVVLIRDTGRIAFANQRFAQLTGVDKETLAGMLFSKFVVRQDQRRVDEFLSYLLHAADPMRDSIEFSIRHGRDREYLVEFNARTISVDNSPEVVASLTDITKKRKSQDDLKKLLDLIPEVVLTTCPEDNTRIVNISNATEKLCAIPSVEFLSGSFHVFDIVHPQDRDQVVRFYQNITEKEFDALEYRIVSADGQTKWVHDEAEVIYKKGGRGRIENILHFIRDITERKMHMQHLTEALEKLRISEQRYRNIVETATDAIFIVKTDGRFQQINPAGLDLFGFSDPEQALNSNINDHYLDMKQRAHVIEQITAHDEITDFPIKIRTCTGDIREVTITAGVKKNSETGELDSYQAIIHDITVALQKTEINTYRRTLKGLADSINNLAQTYFEFLGLLKDNLLFLKQNNSGLSDSVQEIMKDIREFENSLERLSTLGKIVRNAHAKPPGVSLNGIDNEGMYYFETT